MKTARVLIALVLLVATASSVPLAAQSKEEIAYRDKLLVAWKKDGIVPVQGINGKGEQSIAVLAWNWYFPLSYTATAGVPTVLRVYTNKTFDCSRAFNLPQLKIRKTLPPTGVVEIPVPPGKKGSYLYGICSMGMYTFTITYE